MAAPSIPPELAHLPMVPASELTILCELDRFDGPLNGLVLHGGTPYWFEWIEREEEDGPRVFSLHPVGDGAQALAWAERREALGDEFMLILNPHVWPMSERQRASLRSPEVVEEEWKAHLEIRPRWELSPPCACFVESGQQFAAFQTFTVSQEASEAFTQWQPAVAQALHREDQPALDRLFASPPMPGDPLDIYYVHGLGGKLVVRDWRGQPLPEDFLMSARHHVQCLDGLVDA